MKNNKDVDEIIDKHKYKIDFASPSQVVRNNFRREFNAKLELFASDISILIERESKKAYVDGTNTTHTILTGDH